MALVGEPATLCFDGFLGDAAFPFMDAGGLSYGFGYGYDCHGQLLGEECMLGSHPWELPTGVHGTPPGNAGVFGHDDGPWAQSIGVSSSPSASSSVLTFDGQGEDQHPAAWMEMDTTDQLSYGPSKTTTAVIEPPGSFSFGGCGVDDRTASESQKRPRPLEQEDTTTPKKQCGGRTKAAAKPEKSSTPASPPKEPQSLAAKSRRERIGERLRVLQELVPNGDKVDMVTMLDKAITYVKFMQLQLKVLETDEFWPAQGGEAPPRSRRRSTPCFSRRRSELIDRASTVTA